MLRQSRKVDRVANVRHSPPKSVPAVLHDVFMFEMLATTIAQEVTKAAVDGAGAWPNRRTASRADRMEIYLAFQQSVMRSQLRVETLFSVHTAQYNIAHIAAWLTGYPIVVGVLNQLTDDLTHVTSDWQRLRLVATPDVSTTAEHLVLSLCAVLSSVDPGWLKPRVRATHRKELQQAKQALSAASTAFDLAAKADAAPRRRDRRAASAVARGGQSKRT